MISYHDELGYDKANCDFGNWADVMGNDYGLIWKIYYGMDDTNYGNYFLNICNPTD